MSKLKILHLAPTPLVGAPAAISESLNFYTEHESTLYIERDYPGQLADCFISAAVNVGSKGGELPIEEVKSSDVIHVHNFLSQEILEFLKIHSRRSAKFVFHVHSPLREGPLFVNWSETVDIDWSAKLVVGQYQPRLYSSYIIVPNLVSYTPNANVSALTDIPKVLFSPTHGRGGRWNSKSSQLNAFLARLEVELLVENLTPAKFMAPKSLFSLRCTSDITIDEISTGAFHQVSMEGLCAGNVVVNGADSFSSFVMKSWTRSSEDPPYFYCDERNFESRIRELVGNFDYLSEVKLKSIEYFNRYMSRERLIAIYDNIYVKI